MVHCNSQSAIHLCKNPTFHSKLKHIDVKYHYIRNVFEEKQLQLQKILTDGNRANMLRKTLPKERQKIYRQLVGIASH